MVERSERVCERKTAEKGGGRGCVLIESGRKVGKNSEVTLSP